MSRLKRRLLVAVSMVILLAVFAAALLYVPTQRALERAEAFKFRRMLVVRLEDQESYRFFFVTNRDLEPGDAPLEERFGAERAGTVTYGVFDTWIEPSLGLGMIINPTDWFQNEEIRFRSVQTLPQADFVAELRRLVHASPHRSLLVMVNGFRETFPGALRKTAFLSHVLDINSPALVFDWPGNQGSSLRGYQRARDVAIESGADLAETLKLLVHEVQPEKLWLVANSMGAQVVVDAFSLLYQEADLADSQTEIEHVVLTAPDVGKEEFHSRFKREIAALARHLTVYVSSNDRALLMSRVINRARRRGESSLGTLDSDQLEEASRLYDLIDRDEKLITLVDVTPVNRTRNFHNFGLETPEFFDDLYLRLVNDQVPSSRRLYPVRVPDGPIYWVLTSGR